MQISGNFSVSGVDAARSTARSTPTSAPQSSADSGITAPTDQLDLSPEALSIGSSSSTETFRADKVAQLRQAIAQGNYDTDDKLSAALDRFLDKLA